MDALVGRPISAATISYRSLATNSTASISVESDGNYLIPLLPPGIYRVRAQAPGFRAQEVQQLTVAVAGSLTLDFRLNRTTELWDAAQYRSIFLPESDAVITFFGPDVDPNYTGRFETNRGRRGALEPSLSETVAPAEIRDLPLAGRDVYTMIVTVPGVTADAATARGLGVSANGARPTASNFLLDGAENNNYLVTGPLTGLAPESMQEYRISTNNFSAEYGRTSGYLANAVTASGGSAWHGLGYFNLKHEALNGNGFQANRNGYARAKAREFQGGARAGGPLIRERLFVSASWERLTSDGATLPQEYALPSSSWSGFTAPQSVARRLIDRFRPVVTPVSRLPIAPVSLAAPVTFDRDLAHTRLDFVPRASRHRAMARVSWSRVSRPDFVWTPYPDFITPLVQPALSGMVNVTSRLSGQTVNEARVAWNRGRLEFERPHPEIPALLERGQLTSLPGSGLTYSFRNRERGFELADGLLTVRGRHIWKAGGGWLGRNVAGESAAGRGGLYSFADLLDLTIDRPDFFTVVVDRMKLPALSLPAWPREYRLNQWYAYAQDTWRVRPGLTLNFGLRYDDFGAPANIGANRDLLVTLTPTPRFELQTGDTLFRTRRNGLQPRLGFSWLPKQNSRFLFRGAWGLFRDRLFDNLWLNTRNNSGALAQFATSGQAGQNYLAPIAQVLPQYQGRAFDPNLLNATLIDPNLRNATVQSMFLGVEARLSDEWIVEANGAAAFGRHLIATDILNRPSPAARTAPAIDWRSSQGSSNYTALTLKTRYRSGRLLMQASYTWSHSIDNQSEPLSDALYDLSFSGTTDSRRAAQVAAFTRQGDSRVDRGSADFDQRHNFTAYGIYDLPGNWRIAGLAAVRSGFPYSVIAASSFGPQGLLYHNRADLVNPAAAIVEQSIAGGKRLLSAAGFANPANGAVGNTGRNAFAGPGLSNIDLSLSRTFAMSRIREGLSFLIRADFYNVLNHTNLGSPAANLNDTDFGEAAYGRRGRDTGLPSLVPFTETPRQIQLLFRVTF